MSAEEIAASFSRQVTTEADDNDKTTIDFSDFENARSKFPPLVTGTVFETKMLPDDSVKSKLNFDRHDSFHVSKLSEDYDDEYDDDEILDRLRDVDNCLKKKVTEILLKNPWLASKIVQKTNGKLAMKFQTELTQEEAEKRSLKVVRIVTTTAAGSQGIFGSKTQIDTSTTKRQMAMANAPSALDVIIADPITANTYEEIVDAIRPELHTSTESVVKENRSLWNVLLIPLREKSTFARSNKFLLVHSLDSCLADPATLYKIYGMLSADKQAEKLDPVRCKKLDKAKENLLGGDPNFMRCKGIKAANVKRKTIQMSKKSKAFPNTTSVWTIDEDRIEMIKDRQQMKSCLWNDDEFSIDEEPEADYISTNDILTSWFLSQNKDAEVGCLHADMRGRDPEIHPNKAGNYQVEIVYNTRSEVYDTKTPIWEKVHDTRTPAWIRKSVKRIGDEKLKRHKDRNLPGFNHLSGGVYLTAPGASVVSNWSKLLSTLSLEHDGGFILKPECHLPLLLDAHNGFFSSIGWNNMVIFKYTEDKLGAVITAPAKATDGRRLPLDRPALFYE